MDDLRKLAAKVLEEENWSDGCQIACKLARAILASPTPPAASGWRKEPPTVEDVRRCEWWWVRGIDRPDDAEPSRWRVGENGYVEILDTCDTCGEWGTPREVFADVDGCRFAPCLPPGEAPSPPAAEPAIVARVEGFVSAGPWSSLGMRIAGRGWFPAWPGAHVGQRVEVLVRALAEVPAPKCGNAPRWVRGICEREPGHDGPHWRMNAGKVFWRDDAEVPDAEVPAPPASEAPTFCNARHPDPEIVGMRGACMCSPGHDGEHHSGPYHWPREEVASAAPRPLTEEESAEVREVMVEAGERHAAIVRARAPTPGEGST